MRYLKQGPKRLLCCLRLPNTCPTCSAVSYKTDSDNQMRCLACASVWCWTCRKRIDLSKLGEFHFEWYNVFGCPGLKRTPDYFLIGLAAKILVSVFFPVTLLFAPLVVAMANYKPGANIIKDQALRFQEKSGGRVHLTIGKSISLLGFSILGLIAGALIMPIFSPIGILYQLAQVLILLCQGLCSNKAVREEDDFSEYDSTMSPISPSRSPLMATPYLINQHSTNSEQALLQAFKPKLCEKPTTDESSDSLINVDEHETDNYDNDSGHAVTKEVHFDDCEPI